MFEILRIWIQLKLDPIQVAYDICHSIYSFEFNLVSPKKNHFFDIYIFFLFMNKNFVQVYSLFPIQNLAKILPKKIITCSKMLVGL